MKLVYLGDARYNMGNSLMVGCAKMGMHFVACAPKAFMPEQSLIETCKAIARETGEVLEFLEDTMMDTRGAYLLYKYLMDNAGPQCRFMHCLPAYHDHKTEVGCEMGERFGRDAMEVTDEVFESDQSIVFDEAENRMHTIKAVMYELMK